MRTRFLLRLVLVAIPTIGLMLLWLAFLPHAGQAARLDSAVSPAGQQMPTQAPTPLPTPDPRWVEIVRARAAGRESLLAQALSMNLNLTEGFIAGRVPSAAWVDITVLDQGELIAASSVMPVFDGAGFLYWSYIGVYTLEPGYVVWVTQDASAISMTVPVLTSLAYPQTDVLSGTAPANADLTAYLFPFASPEEVYTHTAVASVEGAYLLDWSPAVDLRPRDRGYILYAQDDAHQAYVSFAAPFLRVLVGGSEISGVAAPSSYYVPVYIFVEDASGARLGEFFTYKYSDGSFSGQACDQYGDSGCLSLAPTNRVIVMAGGQTFSMTVITLTAQADQQAGQVFGQAPALQAVEVLRFRGPIGEWGDDLWYQTPLEQVVVTATVDGEYTAWMPLQAGNFGTALVTTTEENQCYIRYALPYLHASLGRPSEYEYNWVRMWGNMSEPLVPITVEVQGPSGYLKDWYTLETRYNGFFDDPYDPENNLSLESGDLITLTIPQGLQISLLLPVLTAEADPATAILSGLAPPFAQLEITLHGYTQLTVTADAAGQYSLDLSGLGGFDNYPSGSVAWTNPEGYTVERSFSVFLETECPPRLDSARIGGNVAHLSGSPGCGLLTFRLRGADGRVKFEYNNVWDPSSIWLFDESGDPILIAIGDQIELIAGGGIETYVVPTLTAVLDPHTDQVYGQAPPFSVLELQFEWYIPLTTTSDAQGVYMADLAGKVDLEAGSAVQVALSSSPHYSAYSVLPVLTAHLYNTLIFGRLQPFTPYTITLHTPVTVTGLVTGSADMAGYFMNNMYPPPVGMPIAQPGDRLEMETPSRGWELTLPWLTARVEASTGVVSGEAPPDSGLKITIMGDCDCSTVVTATTSGTYSAILPVPSEAAYLRGYLTHFTSEDTRTMLDFSTSQWNVILGSRQVSGSAPMVGAPISLTLRSEDGAFSQTIPYTMTMYGGSFWVDFERAVQPGDRLTMETVDGLVNEFTVPYLSAIYDFPRRVLEGRAPVDGELIAHIPAFRNDATRHVRVASNGQYGVDTSDVFPMIGGQGWVIYTDQFGNTVQRLFYIRGYPQYLPVIRCLATAP